MGTTATNGARIRILRVLAIEGMLTTQEIADKTGLTAGQVRDNANHASGDSLLIKKKDDFTGLLAYQISPIGRKWLADRIDKAQTLLQRTGGNDSTPPSNEPPIESDEVINEPAANEPQEVIDALPAAPPDAAPSSSDCYAIHHPTRGLLIAGTDVDDAKAMAKSVAELHGKSVPAYRLVCLGQAVLTTRFEDS